MDTWTVCPMDISAQEERNAPRRSEDGIQFNSSFIALPIADSDAIRGWGPHIHHYNPHYWQKSS